MNGKRAKQLAAIVNYHITNWRATSLKDKYNVTKEGNIICRGARGNYKLLKKLYK